MPIFTNPAAIWGTLIFLGLIAVYLYRRRSRNYVVSSLMFFAKSKSTAEGGQKIHKLQLPLIFFVEFLILLFFILAIANPMSLQKGQLVPLTVVLDDSVSMTAGGEGFSPRSQAVRFLEEHLFSEKIYRITIVKAGRVPTLVGKRDMTGTEAANALQNWDCRSVATAINEAVAHGISVSSEDAVIFVVTDQPKADSENENIKWLSFGKPLENMAITAAHRSASGRVDRCFFEFSNFSDKTKELDAEIIDLSSGSVIERIAGSVSAKSSRRAILKISDQNAAIKAVIKNDAVAYDNEAVLLPVIKNKVKVAIRLSDANLADAVKKAVKATELSIITNTEPDLLICDDNGTADKQQLLGKVVIYNASQPAFIKEIAVNGSEHQITSDLPGVDAMWAADANMKPRGEILIAGGLVPLLWIENNNNNYPTIGMNYCHGSSNLHQTNFWPVLFYNIIDWTSQRLSGPNNSNFRSGSRVEFYSDRNLDKISITNKDKPSETEQYNVQNGKSFFYASNSGLYEITAGDKNYNISINLCSYEESDLTKADYKVELPKIISDENMSHFENVKWWFIILAFILMLVHQWLISRGRAGYAF